VGMKVVYATHSRQIRSSGVHNEHNGKGARIGPTTAIHTNRNAMDTGCVPSKRNTSCVVCPLQIAPTQLANTMPRSIDLLIDSGAS